MRVHSERNAGTSHQGTEYHWQAGEVIEVPDELGNVLVTMPDGGFVPEADLPAGEPETGAKPTRGRGRDTKKEITEVDPDGAGEPETGAAPDAS